MKITKKMLLLIGTIIFFLILSSCLMTPQVNIDVLDPIYSDVFLVNSDKVSIKFLSNVKYTYIVGVYYEETDSLVDQPEASVVEETNGGYIYNVEARFPKAGKYTLKIWKLTDYKLGKPPVKDIRLNVWSISAYALMLGKSYELSKNSTTTVYGSPNFSKILLRGEDPDGNSIIDHKDEFKLTIDARIYNFDVSEYEEYSDYLVTKLSENNFAYNVVLTYKNSEIATFPIEIEVPSITLKFPEKNAIVDPESPTFYFQWDFPKDKLGEISNWNFQMYINEMDMGWKSQNIIIKPEEGSTIQGNLNEGIVKFGGILYKWKIRAVPKSFPDEYVESEFSVFTTKNNVPDTPNLLSPSDGATVEDSTVNFKFRIGDNDEYTNEKYGLVYVLYIKKGENGEFLAFPGIDGRKKKFTGESTDIVYQKDDLDHGYDYYWYIEVRDVGGATSTSSVKMFHY